MSERMKYNKVNCFKLSKFNVFPPNSPEYFASILTAESKIQVQKNAKM